MNDTDFNPLSFDVISIQSQVVYGTVGNCAARPTFERFGLRVCTVPTVLLSNIPMYNSMHGGVIPTDWFAGYLEDLAARRALLDVRAVVLGYLGTPEQADILADWLTNLRRQRPDIQIIVDPVMGDHDSGFYVRPELSDNYRSRLCACADLITPNHFELEYLSGQKCPDLESVILAARSLLTGNIKTVIVTSSPGVANDSIANLIVTADNTAQTIHPRVDCYVKGTGDTFQATLTSALLTGKTLIAATKMAGDYVVEALRYTQAKNCGELLYPPQ